jgi:hypothetical protein
LEGPRGIIIGDIRWNYLPYNGIVPLSPVNTKYAFQAFRANNESFDDITAFDYRITIVVFRLSLLQVGDFL